MNFVDIEGSGFVSGVPGLYGNCRVYYDNAGVHYIGPLYQEWNEHPEPIPTPEPAPTPEPEPPPEPQDVTPPPPVFQVNGG